MIDLSALLQHEIAVVTGMPVESLDPDTPFAGFGIESLQAVNIAANLSQKLGRDISVTLFFDHPTIRDLADHLSGASSPPLAKATSGNFEPLAIVGLACRFPGAESAEKFWYNLSFGVDAVGETPESRWNWRDYPELPAMRWGGFLSDIHSFDSEMFGIPESEAERMDPQQKVLLQCVHEAVESAGLSLGDLDKSRTGVFVGISSSDFSLRPGKSASVFDATGNAHSIAANRVSYLFNLKGPSLSIDTACSSSLVAFHEAGKSLQNGECDLAIVGGVNVILEPAITKAFAEAGMLSPEGRCKTFSAGAAGYVRGEGVGVVLLRRAKDATAPMALVRGTAVNHDGRTNGLTAPSGTAQEEVIREALSRAGLNPEDISFAEAHGTGTSLGDPIEFHALARVFGGERPEKLSVGSAKAFVGHLEAAAGICGIIKATLALRYGTWPRQIHFSQLNPEIKENAVRVATEPTPCPWGSRAAISSFGFGGTNAHAILESVAPRAPQKTEGDGPLFLCFSATSPSALREFGARWEESLGVEESRARAIVEKSAAERLRYKLRLACWGRSRDDLLAALVQWRRGEAGNWIEKEVPRGFRPKVAFLFTGQGAQFAGMAQDIYESESVFRELWHETLTSLEPYFPAGLLRVARGLEPELSQTNYGQALLFSLELALARFFSEHWKVEPSIVGGHSLGEIGAAAWAGVFSAGDASRFVAARGELMQKQMGRGAMASVKIREGEPLPEGVEIAAVNGEDLLSLSGRQEAIRDFLKKVQGKELPVDRAFHSAAVEEILPALKEILDSIKFSAPRIPLVSSLTGKRHEDFSAGYWLEQARKPTQFLSLCRTLAAEGVNVVLEIGPQPVLTPMGLANAPKIQWVPALRKNRSGEWMRALAELSLLGARNFPRVASDIPLPLTPFHRGTKEVTMAAPELLKEFQILVAGLLQVPEVDPDTNLIDLGADSLLLLNAIQTIKERHGVTIAVADVFRDLGNLRAIADFVQQKKAPVSMKVARNNQEAVRSSVHYSGDLKTIIDQQLEIMRQQLVLLGGSEATVAAPLAKEAPLVAPVPAVNPPAEGAPAPKGVLGNWRSRANREVGPQEQAKASYLEDFIRKFNERTAGTKAHTQKYRAQLADNRVSAGFRPNMKEMVYTIVFEKGKGAHFTDIDGNDYVDFTMGFGVNLFGHSPDFVEKKIRAQLAEGYSVGPQAALAGTVAEKACHVLGQDRIAFLNSGTEAVMTAIRLARTVTGRNRVVIFEGSYHGHADVVLARAGQRGSVPVAPGVPTGIVGDVVVLPYGEKSAEEYIRSHGHELAAVLVEPVQSRYPEFQPVDFLREIRKLTEQCGTAFIFDEVICGLRVAPAGAQELFGIKPDLSCYGKVLGGGLPIGAVAGSARYLDPIDGGSWQFGDDSYPKAEMTFFAGTFCKHPLALAACEAVLDRFLENGSAITQELNKRTAALCARLNEILEGYDLQANNFGSLFRFKSNGNIDLFFAQLNFRGIYVWEGRNLFLSTAHTDADLDTFCRAVADAVTELDREGFLKKL